MNKKEIIKYGEDIKSRIDNLVNTAISLLPFMSQLPDKWELNIDSHHVHIQSSEDDGIKTSKDEFDFVVSAVTEFIKIEPYLVCPFVRNDKFQAHAAFWLEPSLCVWGYNPTGCKIEYSKVTQTVANVICEDYSNRSNNAT